MIVNRLTKFLNFKPFKSFWNKMRMHLAATRWLSKSVGSIAILCLHTVLVFFPCIISFVFHLFNVSFILYLICFVSYLFRILIVSRLLCFVSYKFCISSCISSILCPTYSVHQDLNHSLTLRSFLNLKPHLKINPVRQKLRPKYKDIYKVNSTSCILESYIGLDR